MLVLLFFTTTTGILRMCQCPFFSKMACKSCFESSVCSVSTAVVCAAFPTVPAVSSTPRSAIQRSWIASPIVDLWGHFVGQGHMYCDVTVSNNATVSCRVPCGGTHGYARSGRATGCYLLDKESYTTICTQRTISSYS